MSTLTGVQESSHLAAFDPPRPQQMAVLRLLAMRLGETFIYPHTAKQASEEIVRMESRDRDSDVEAWIERRNVSRDLSFFGDASAVRDSEIVGYGASAHWR